MIAAALLTIYGHTMNYPLLRDDLAHLGTETNTKRWSREPREVLEHFREGFWPDHPETALYRPLTALTIQGTEWIAKSDLKLLRAGNVIMLFFLSLLVSALGERHGLSEWPATFLGVVIAVHPLMTETVMEIVSRSETQSAIGIIGAAVILETQSSAYSFLCCALALLFAFLSKEGSFAAVPALAYLVFATSQRRHWIRPICVMVLCITLVFMMRIRVFGSPLGLDPHQITLLDNPVASLPFGKRLASGVEVLGRYVTMYIWPSRLSADWSFKSIPTSIDLSDPYFVVGALWVVLIATWSARLCRGRLSSRGEVFGLTLSASAWFLVSSILFPIGTQLGERLMCLPVVGMTTAIVHYACVAGIRIHQSRTYLRWVAAAVILALGARSFARTLNWKSLESLYIDANSVAPNSARVHCALGEAYRQRGDVDLAIEEFRASIAILPGFQFPHLGLTHCFGLQEKNGKALVHLWLAAHFPLAGDQVRKQCDGAFQDFLDDKPVHQEFADYATSAEFDADIPAYRDLRRFAVDYGQ